MDSDCLRKGYVSDRLHHTGLERVEDMPTPLKTKKGSLGTRRTIHGVDKHRTESPDTRARTQTTKRCEEGMDREGQKIIPLAHVEETKDPPAARGGHKGA